VHNRVITRGLTIAGVAIGSALLIGALAVAMRGLAPVATSAAAKPATASSLRMLNRPAHKLIKQLAAWHAPRIPKVHRHRAAAPRVVTVTAPPTVIPAPQSAASTTAAAPPTSTGTSGGYGQDDGSGSGDD
jgi:hypothetical protein